MSFLVLRSTVSSELSVEQDWINRSTAAGVFYANNFDFADTAALIASAAQTSQNTKIALDTTIKLSGTGSFRSNLLASAGANESPGAYSLSFAGVGSSAKTVSKHQFYFQVAVYAHSVWRNFGYDGGSAQASKLGIIFAPDQSFDIGEVVFGRLSTADAGFYHTYRIPGTGPNTATSTTFYNQWNDYGPNYQYYPFYDAGSPTVVSTNTLQQRHGPTYSGTTGDDADLVNAPRIVADGWTVFTFYVDLVNDIVKQWVGPYGEAPTLLIGAMAAKMPAAGFEDGGGFQIFTGAQLLPRTENTVAWPAEDTHVNYTEVIASDNAINHPGGFALPYPGTETPPGYPPAGSFEV